MSFVFTYDLRLTPWQKRVCIFGVIYTAVLYTVHLGNEENYFNKGNANTLFTIVGQTFV